MTMTLHPTDAAAILTTEVAAAITASVPDIEHERRLPARLVTTLTEAGLFRLLNPHEVGGSELEPAHAARVLEDVARLDASVAWCVWNGNCGFAAPLLDPAAAEAVFGPGAPVGNSARVGGALTPVDGGFRLSGRWDLVSGSDHQPWIILFAMVMEAGAPRMLGGRPDLRACFVRREQLSVVDRWHVLGLRGTASNEVVVDDQFVPEAFTAHPFAPSRIDRTLYRLPVFAVSANGVAAVCLGIAQGAIDDLMTLARSKTSVRGPEPLAALAPVQAAVAEADARLRAARGGYHAALEALTRLAASGEQPGLADRGRLRAAMTLAARTARDVTLQMFELGSSTAIYDACPLSRHVRDVLVAAQHVMVQPVWFEEAGRTLFDLDPTLPIL